MSTLSVDMTTSSMTSQPLFPMGDPQTYSASNPSKRVRTSSQPSSPLQPCCDDEKSTSSNSSRELLETSHSSVTTMSMPKAELNHSTQPEDLNYSSRDMNHTTNSAGINFKCVYGRRRVNGINIYLRRLKDGGWIEHDELDTCFIYDHVDITKDSFPNYWEPIDYPPFFSRRARYYEDHEVEGINKGNVRLKPKYFREYTFDDF